MDILQHCDLARVRVKLLHLDAVEEVVAGDAPAGVADEKLALPVLEADRDDGRRRR